MDFSAITGAISATEVVSAIAVISGIKVAPKAAKWGWAQLMGMFGK